MNNTRPPFRTWQIATGARICLMAVAFVASCGHSKSEETTREMAEAGGKPSPSRILFEGLAAAPGSAARRRAADVLEKQLTKAYAAFRQDADNETRREQTRTKRILAKSIDALRQGSSCPAGSRIRVYRGFGRLAPLKPAPNASPGFTIFSHWHRAMTEELGPRVLEREAQPGVALFKKADALRVSALENLPWPVLLGKDRQEDDGRPGSPEINLRWDRLARAHAGSSDRSLLMSTTLLPDVAARFGPPALVADICPERALFMGGPYFTAAGEAEVLVPLFLLPEEIVRIEGKPCPADGEAGCRGMTLVDRSSRNSITQTLHNCYFNFGHALERNTWVSRTAEKHFVDVTRPASLALWDAPLTTWAFRDRFQGLAKTCQPSCAHGTRVLSAGREALRTARASGVDAAERDELERNVTSYEKLLSARCR